MSEVLKENKKLNVYQKLSLARKMLLGKNLKKSGKNVFSKYDYFELSDFLPAINEIFADIGLLGVFNIGELAEEVATLRVINVDDPNESILFRSKIADAEIKGCLPIQSLGGVHTYMRRYLYLNALEIAEHDLIDEKGNNENALDTKQTVNIPKVTKPTSTATSRQNTATTRQTTTTATPVAPAPVTPSPDQDKPTLDQDVLSKTLNKKTMTELKNTPDTSFNIEPKKEEHRIPYNELGEVVSADDLPFPDMITDSESIIESEPVVIEYATKEQQKKLINLYTNKTNRKPMMVIEQLRKGKKFTDLTIQEAEEILKQALAVAN